VVELALSDGPGSRPVPGTTAIGAPQNDASQDPLGTECGQAGALEDRKEIDLLLKDSLIAPNVCMPEDEAYITIAALTVDDARKTCRCLDVAHAAGGRVYRSIVMSELVLNCANVPSS